MSQAKPRLWTGAFALAWVANFLHSTGFHAFVHAPGWLELHGAGEVGIGVLMATFSVAAILARPVLGRLMDTRGRRLVVVTGGVFHVLTGLLYLGVDALAGTSSAPATFALIAGVRVVHGIAEAALFSVLFTYAADMVPEQRRAEGIALFGISGMIPLALGGLIGDWVIVDGDYRGLFATTTAVAAAALLCSAFLPETGRKGRPGRSFFAAAAAPELRSLWVVGTAFAMGLAAYFVFLKTYLLDAPAVGTMGQFFTTYAIAAVALRLGFGWVPERVGLIRVLVPSMVVTAIGLVTIAMATSPIHLIAAAIACGVGHGFAFPILSALVVTRARPDERGSAVALFTALFDLGVLVGGPTFGLIVKLGSYPATFGFAAVLVAAVGVAFGLYERGRHSSSS